MEFCSTTDPEFLETVASWIDSDGEVFLVIHFPDRGGRPVFDRFVTFAGFRNRISHLPPSAAVVVCKGIHVGLSGVVDDVFIASVLDAVPAGQEWAVIGNELLNDGTAWWSNEATGNTHEELQTQLRSETFYGESVRAGELPPWRDSSVETVATGVVLNPHADNTILPRYSLRTLLATVAIVAISLWLLQHLGSIAAVAVPWGAAIAFLLLGRKWKWRVEAVFVCFALGIPGFWGALILRSLPR